VPFSLLKHQQTYQSSGQSVPVACSSTCYPESLQPLRSLIIKFSPLLLVALNLHSSTKLELNPTIQMLNVFARDFTRTPEFSLFNLCNRPRHGVPVSFLSHPISVEIDVPIRARASRSFLELGSCESKIQMFDHLGYHDVSGLSNALLVLGIVSAPRIYGISFSVLTLPHESILIANPSIQF
jgi:hypothetical protein